MYNNILVIQTAFIGDAILASSLVEKLHHRFPEAAISILVRKGNENIYEQHPFLKDLLVWNKKEKKLKNLFGLLSRIRKNKYDCVVNCHRFASSGMLAAFSKAKHISGYKENPFSFLFNTTVRHSLVNGWHETERYTQLVSDFAGEEVFRPKLYPSALDKEKVKIFQTGKYVCMAPASVWFTKALPKEKWIEICKSISTDTDIYLLGARGDVTLCQEIQTKSGGKKIHVLAGQLTLLQSAELMKGANMNFVNDSAPLHLASSVNAAVTSFFCSTIPQFGFGPVSDNSTVIEVEKLPCKPCGIHGYKACPLGHFKCGYDIDLSKIPYLEKK